MGFSQPVFSRAASVGIAVLVRLSRAHIVEDESKQVRRLDNALENAPDAVNRQGEGCESYLQYLRLQRDKCPKKWNDMDLDDDDFQGARCVECNPSVRTAALEELLARLPAESEVIRFPRTMSNSTVSLIGSIPDNLVTRFPKLAVLDLSMHGLTGTIPSSLWTHTHLKELRLSGNGLSGQLPSRMAASLTHILLGGNWLTGSLPESLGELKSLTHIDLSYNLFEGPIPQAVEHWTEVLSVNFAGNRFSGSLPEGIGHWRKVESVLLQVNQFAGSIPLGIGNWTELRTVDLSGGPHFSDTPIGYSGTIPKEVGNWRKVKFVAMRGNLLSGEIPEEVGNWKEVNYVHFVNNEISGAFPKAVGNWRKVKIVEFGYNRLNGSLPQEVGQWHSLEVLRVRANQITGPIPKEVANWRNVSIVDMPNNLLSGNLPQEVGSWQNLMYIDFQGNQLTGDLPDAVGNWSTVNNITLNGNHLSGEIPMAVRRWTKLHTLQLQNNRFSGSLPVAVGAWSNVETLDLSNNALSSLPVEVGSWQRLTTLSLANNQLEGPLPSSVGNWSRLEQLSLAGNSLSGELPSEISSWTRVTHVDLSGNAFSGAVPRGIGSWSSAREVSLDGNGAEGLASLPAEMALLGNLETFSMQNSKLSGKLPDLSALTKLKELRLRGNRITDCGPLPPALELLDISMNKLRALPQAFQILPKMLDLIISDNEISSWPSRGFFEIFGLNINPMFMDPFQWPNIRRLDASGNPLAAEMVLHFLPGVPVIPGIFIFLNTLSHLNTLNSLTCRKCSLTGALEAQTLPGLIDVITCVPTGVGFGPGALACSKKPGFTGLQSLDLAENSITGIAATPPQGLFRADLSRNAIRNLDLAWFNLQKQNTVAELKISGNPQLRIPVQPPKGVCSSNGEDSLVVDPRSYFSHGEGYECATLCPGSVSRYTTDSTLDSSAMCRCKAGYGGRGTDCKPCEEDTYNAANDEFQLIRTCEICPALSDTNGSRRVEDISGCKCPAGTFLDRAAKSCSHCPQWPFRATKVRGEVQASACACNASYSGLKEFAGICGCDEGRYMNHKKGSCEKCLNSELCAWGTNLSKSLEPPPVKAGFWAEPVEDMTMFAGNDIWRCTGADSCYEGGTCASGRQGKACALCQPGSHGGPSGACKPCSGHPEDRRWLLAASSLSLVPVVLVIHMGLTAGTDKFSVFMQLRAVRSSTKQMVKHLQTVSVIGGLSVAWPSIAETFFRFLARFTLKIPTLLEVGCLQDGPSAALEMAAKWLLPVIFVVIALATMPMTWVFARLLRRLPCRSGSFLGRQLQHAAELLSMDLSDVARVLLFSLTIFWSTLVANSFEMLTCSLSPNGKLTVATYPHVECNLRRREYAVFAVLSLLNVLLYLGIPLRVLYRAYKTSSAALATSNRVDRGWHAFLFDDFRDGYLLWLVHIMVRDALFVLIAAALPGQGAAQLLLVAAVSAAHGVWVMHSTPFHDRSNSLLEAWNCASAGVLCVYSVGMGYERTAGVEDIQRLFQEGTDDPIYQGRAIGMVVVQVIAIAVPSVVVLFQILCAIERTRGMLPQRMKPVSREESDAWLNSFLEDMNMISTEMAALLEKCDMTDMHHFRSFIHNTSATMGMRISRKSSSNLVQMANKLSRDSSITVKESCGSDDDAPTESGDDFDNRDSGVESSIIRDGEIPHSLESSTFRDIVFPSFGKSDKKSALPEEDGPEADLKNAPVWMSV